MIVSGGFGGSTGGTVVPGLVSNILRISALKQHLTGMYLKVVV